MVIFVMNGMVFMERNICAVINVAGGNLKTRSRLIGEAFVATAWMKMRSIGSYARTVTWVVSARRGMDFMGTTVAVVVNTLTEQRIMNIASQWKEHSVPMQLTTLVGDD